MSVERVLSALIKVDPDTAGFLVTAVAMDEVSKAASNFVDEYGPDLVGYLRGVEHDFRTKAANEYMFGIAKSGHVPERVHQLTAAADEADALANKITGELVSKGFFEDWLLDGRTVRREVKRDDKGRFARTMSAGAKSGPESGWSFAGQADDWMKNNRRSTNSRTSKQPFTIPEQSVGDARLQQTDGGPVEFQEGVVDADVEETERWLGQLKAVQELDRELLAAFPNDKDDLELNVLLQGVDNSLERQAFDLGDSGQFNFDPSSQDVVESEWGPKPGLSPERTAELYGKMAMNQMGVHGYAAPEMLGNLGRAISERNKGLPSGGEFEAGYAQGFPTKLERSMRQWENVMSTLPGKKPRMLGQFLNQINDSGFHEATEAMRPGVTRASYRFRGNSRVPDPSMVSQVDGSLLTDDELRLFDTTVGIAGKRPRGQKKADQASGVGSEAERLAQAKNYLATLEANPPGDEVGTIEREMWEEQVSSAAAEVKSLSGPKSPLNRALAAGNRTANRNQRGKSDVLAPGYMSDNYAFNGLKRRLDAGQEGVSATQGAQRDAAAMFLLSQKIEELAQLREGDRGQRADGDMTRSNRGNLLNEIAGRVGRTFPSEGVLINSKGQIIQQSVGVGDDHYLPFDLPAYKSLIGGSYTRTRSMGGLTTEDLLASIAGGGRAAQVVSPSGVFEIEFDLSKTTPSKLSRIPEMYDQILDQVSAGGLYVTDLSSEELDAVDEQLSRRPDYKTLDGDSLRDLRIAAIDARRRELSIVKDNDPELKKRIERITAMEPDMTPAKIKTMAKKELRKERVRELTINGEGYEVALQTLKRYFPYVIKNVSRQDLTTFASQMNPKQKGLSLDAVAGFAESGARDKGRPGRNPMTGKRNVGVGAGDYGLDFKATPQREKKFYEDKADNNTDSTSDASAASTPNASAAGGEMPAASGGVRATTVRAADVGNNEKIDAARNRQATKVATNFASTLASLKGSQSELAMLQSIQASDPSGNMTSESLVNDVAKNLLESDIQVEPWTSLIYVMTSNAASSNLKTDLTNRYINNVDGFRDKLTSESALENLEAVATGLLKNPNDVLEKIESNIADIEFANRNFQQGDTTNPSVDFAANNDPIWFNNFTDVEEPKQLAKFLGDSASPLDDESPEELKVRQMVSSMFESERGGDKGSNVALQEMTRASAKVATAVDADNSLSPTDDDVAGDAAQDYATYYNEGIQAGVLPDEHVQAARMLANAFVREHSVRWRQASLMWSADPKVRGGSTPPRPVRKAEWTMDWSLSAQENLEGMLSLRRR